MITRRMDGLLDVEAAAELCALVDSAGPGSDPLLIDLSECTGFETVALAMLVQALMEARNRGADVTTTGAQAELASRIESLTRDAADYRKPAKPGGFRHGMIQIGEKVDSMLMTLKGLAVFASGTFRAVARIRTNPRLLRVRQTLYYMEQAGVDAVSIIAILCWLLGVVLGFQAGYQLKNFAAETFMPDLIAYSMTWEIGPLLAAVMVAGRSGSAFAAELGTMKVRQETDALTVMGMDIWSYLVTPKMLALMVVMPFLVLLADFFGLLGGLLIGGWYLDMPAHVYISRLALVVIPMDIWWGMLKSLVYAVIISNVGCYMGMRVRGGAAEVGRATTSAVVTSIFLVIVADAIISLIFVFIRPTVTV